MKWVWNFQLELFAFASSHFDADIYADDDDAVVNDAAADNEVDAADVDDDFDDATAADCGENASSNFAHFRFQHFHPISIKLLSMVKIW